MQILGPRYSIIPGDFVDDLRASLVHYRVLNALGRRTNKHGWCYLNQSKLAATVDYTRQSVNAAIADLVEWGYVEKRGQSDTKRNICTYRVIIDPAADNPRNCAACDDGITEVDEGKTDDAAGDDDAPSGNEPSGQRAAGVSEGAKTKNHVSNRSDTSPHVSKKSDTSVGSKPTPVSGLTRHINDPPLLNTPPLTTTAPVGAEGGRGSHSELFGHADDAASRATRQNNRWGQSGWARGWSDGARAEVLEMLDNGPTAHVAVDFVDAVRGTLAPSPSVDGTAYVRQLRHRLRPFGGDVLGQLAALMLDTRGRDLPPANEVEAQAKAIKAKIEAEARKTAPTKSAASPAIPTPALDHGLLKLLDALAAMPNGAAARASLSGISVASFDGRVLTLRHRTDSLADTARRFQDLITDAASFAFDGATAVHIIGRGRASAHHFAPSDSAARSRPEGALPRGATQ